MNRLALALAAGAITTSAQAAVVNTYTNEASFLAAAGAVVTETFDPFFALNGATAIAGNNVQTAVGVFSVSQNGGGSGTGVFDPKVDDGPSASDYEIDAAGPAYLQLRSERSPVLHFASPIRAFGATFNSISSVGPTLTVAGMSYNLYDILGIAPAGFAAPAQDGGFFGFILDAPVNSFTIASGGADTFALDNAHISAVPLPAGALLLVTGLGGAAFVGRRKRRT